MSIQPLTRNITRAFREATDNDRAIGHGWYSRARTLAVKLALNEMGLTREPTTSWGQARLEHLTRKYAGVIAALSPRLSWRKNVEYAELSVVIMQSIQRRAAVGDVLLTDDMKEAIFAGMMPTLNANARKAYKIMTGTDPEDVLRGPKVTAFYWTIVNPADPRAVVVDRHAVAIAFNRPLTDDEIHKVLGPKAAYGTISDLYRRAARIISAELNEFWTPAQVQATTWTYWRRERAVAYHGEA